MVGKIDCIAYYRHPVWLNEEAGQLTRVVMKTYATAISYRIFLRATLKILSQFALDSSAPRWGLPSVGERGERGSAERDNRRGIHGSSSGTTALNEGRRVIQAFAAPHANKNDVEIPKKSLADLVSATPSAGPAWDECNEPVALMSWTAERMTATTAWPDINDWITVGPKRDATATTEVWRYAPQQASAMAVVMMNVANMPSERWMKVLSVRRHVSKARHSIDHRVR